MTQHNVPLSPAAHQDEDAKQSACPALPELLVKQKEVLEIVPITTYNDWVIIVPFTIETNLLLPATTDYRNIGVVVGKSDSILTPHGERVKSVLAYGQVVLFQKRSVVGEMSIAREPYIGRKLIILSERNIVCRLPAVQVKVIDGEIGVGDFPKLQPEDE